MTWLDAREGRAAQQVARSGDGGATWSQGQRFAGDPAKLVTGFDLNVCQGDLGVDAGSALSPGWTLTNRNPLFADSYTWTLKSQRDWPLAATGTATADARSTAGIHPTIAVPDSAAPGTNRMCMIVTDAHGAQSRACCFTVTVQKAPLDVPILTSAFDLQARATDPASRRWRIDFSLPYDGPVRVTIYGIKGDRIRTLADGSRSAGPNSIIWDGRDDRGDQADAGAYVCRLEGFGSVKVQRLFWLR
jgi:hypothetical protein